jgi:hypothetical protein
LHINGRGAALAHVLAARPMSWPLLRLLRLRRKAPPASTSRYLRVRTILVVVPRPAPRPLPVAQSASGVDAPFSTCAHVLDRGAQAGCKNFACGVKRLL